MAEFPNLPLWTDSFLADTTHLDAKETGAYLMLIISAWRSHDCGIPNDDKKLARMARCSLREWRNIKDDVLSFWHLKDNKFYQKKLLKVRSDVTAKSEKAKHAAQSKWLKNKETGNADASIKHMPQTCQPKPKPKPVDKEEDTNVSPKKKYKQSFEDFWLAYPVKKGKGAASKAFDNALKRASLEDIANGLNKILPSWGLKDPQYIPHPTTWLNRDGWHDEPDKPMQGSNGGLNEKRTMNEILDQYEHER